MSKTKKPLKKALTTGKLKLGQKVWAISKRDGTPVLWEGTVKEFYKESVAVKVLGYPGWSWTERTGVWLTKYSEAKGAYKEALESWIELKELEVVRINKRLGEVKKLLKNLDKSSSNSPAKKSKKENSCFKTKDYL